MGEFRYLDHTGEVGIVATGATAQEVFAVTAQALFGLLADLDGVEEHHSIEVEVASESMEELLVEWLNELIYQSESKGLLLKRFEVRELSSRRLRARCFGEKIDPKNHRLGSGVKAATYHQATVRGDGQWHAQVILDV